MLVAFEVLPADILLQRNFKNLRVMSQQMIAWCVIAGVLLCAFVLRALERYIVDCHHRIRFPKHFLESGREREMFFVPGDDESDEFDDL